MRLTSSRALMLAASPLVFLLGAPLLALVLGAPGERGLDGLLAPVTVAALRVSLTTSACALALVLAFGTPLAWALSRATGRLSRVFTVLTLVPIILPPAVAGLALLMAFGSQGIFGRSLSTLGVRVAYTPFAVVLAQAFVSSPFYVLAALRAFATVDAQQVWVARALGCSPWQAFRRVVLPAAAPGLAVGAMLAWARAVGEFGATLLFAGNLSGVTQTLPLAIYAGLDVSIAAARAAALLLVAVALACMAGVGGAVVIARGRRGR